MCAHGVLLSMASEDGRSKRSVAATAEPASTATTAEEDIATATKKIRRDRQTGAPISTVSSAVSSLPAIKDLPYCGRPSTQDAPSFDQFNRVQWHSSMTVRDVVEQMLGLPKSHQHQLAIVLYRLEPSTGGDSREVALVEETSVGPEVAGWMPDFEEATKWFGGEPQGQRRLPKGVIVFTFPRAVAPTAAFPPPVVSAPPPFTSATEVGTHAHTGRSVAHARLASLTRLPPRSSVFGERAPRAAEALAGYLPEWRRLLDEIPSVQTLPTTLKAADYPFLRSDVPLVFYGSEKGTPDLRLAALPKSLGADARARRVLSKLDQVGRDAMGGAVKANRQLMTALAMHRARWFAFGGAY